MGLWQKVLSWLILVDWCRGWDWSRGAESVAKGSRRCRCVGLRKLLSHGCHVGIMEALHLLEFQAMSSICLLKEVADRLVKQLCFKTTGKGRRCRIDVALDWRSLRAEHAYCVAIDGRVDR